MVDRIRTDDSDFEFNYDYLEEDYDEYLEEGLPYNEELDFNKDPETVYEPEPEDDYWRNNPVEDE